VTLILDPPAFTLEAVRALNRVHTWNGGTPLNDLFNPDGTQKFPRARLLRAPGFSALADMADNRSSRVGRVGETPRFTLPSSKTIGYEGVIEATNEDDLQNFTAQLVSTFSARDATMLISPFTGVDQNWQFTGRVVALDVPQEFASSMKGITRGHSRSFTVQIRLDEPFFYTSNLLADFWFAGGTKTITNLGTAPTPPRFELPGPGTNATLINTTLGVQLRISGINVLTGNFLVIDFKDQKIQQRTGAGVITDLPNALDESLTTWWDPGVDGLRGVRNPDQDGTNILSMPGGGFASVNVYWRHAMHA
jgi:hypothetical protein